MLTYSELITIPTFSERFKYLKLDGVVGKETFAFERYLNQVFYRSPEWRALRNHIVVRDNGCDLGVDGHEIFGRSIIIHHLNPITSYDINNRSNKLMDPENLICTSQMTHNAIHYGDESFLFINEVADRKDDDTKLW